MKDDTGAVKALLKQLEDGAENMAVFQSIENALSTIVEMLENGMLKGTDLMQIANAVAQIKPAVNVEAPTVNVSPSLRATLEVPQRGKMSFTIEKVGNSTWRLTED